MGRLSTEDKLKHCAGCRNNFYNGNNSLGVTRCWSLADAKLILRKRVHINQVPPWTQKPTKILSCYHESQYVFVNCEERDRQC